MLQNKIQNFPINLAIFPKKKEYYDRILPFYIYFWYFGEISHKNIPLIGGRETAMLIECKTNALLEVDRFHAL
jgi:hypothetical protein